MNDNRQLSLRDFAVFSLFGVKYADISNKDIKDRVLVCAERAYRDMARTLSYKESDKQTKKDNATAFRKRIYSTVIPEIIDLLKVENASDFDVKHNRICSTIVSMGNDDKSREYLYPNPRGDDGTTFYYGQAQKWVNMTLKYLWMLDWIPEDVLNIEELSSWFHIPIDSLIIKAAVELGKQNELELKVPGKHNDNEEVASLVDYKEGRTQPWSRWSQNDYLTFRKQMTAVNWGENLFDWERDAWIAQAKNTNSKPLDWKTVCSDER